MRHIITFVDFKLIQVKKTTAMHAIFVSLDLD